MLDFLAELKNNNNRPWFARHKEAYDAIRKECLEEVAELIDAIARFDPHLAGVSPEMCVYRIYRDLRFSPDKSPFKTHFGVVLGHGGKKCKEAAYYLHVEPGECALYGGVWFPERPVLNFLRHNILDNIDEFLEIVEAPEFKSRFPRLTGDSLKTLPKGFPADCPHPEIIRMKEFLVQKSYNDCLFSQNNWLEQVADDVSVIRPLNDFLNYAFEELHMA